MHQRRRRTVAQAPQHDVRNAGLLLQRGDRGADVGVHPLEIPRFTGAVTHTAIVEAERRYAGRRERARQRHELPMTADAVLRTADDDDYGDVHA